MMSKKIPYVLFIAACVLFFDHLTKWLVVKYIPQGTHIVVIPNIFDLVHGRNPGAAFGFLSSWDSPLRNWFFYIMAIFALVFLYFYLKNISVKNRLMLTVVGLILGGALGNVTDRLIRGSVVDFLSFHYHNKIWQFSLMGYHFSIPLEWPAFNIADSAISTSLVLIIFYTLFNPNQDPQ